MDHLPQRFAYRCDYPINLYFKLHKEYPFDVHTGFIRQPKWGHLRDLHLAIKHCEEYLISSDPTHQQLGHNLEAHIYYKSSNDCAAFLANYDSNLDANVTFNGNLYFLPAWSVSILPDCKNVIFNTAKVVSQRNFGDNSFAQTTTVNQFSLSASSWSWYNEEPGVWGNNLFTESRLLEQISTTKDTSDYLWYTTSINIMPDQSKEVFLLIESLGHAALIFVNKRLVAFGYGNHDDASFSISEKISLVEGNNTLDMLSMMVGLQNFGPWFDVQGAGIFSVVLVDPWNRKNDVSSGEWTYQVGLEGEYLGLDKVSLANSSLWKKGSIPPVNKTLIWYKVTFLAPEGKGPLALNLTSMGKGQAWVNGQSIGRYWPAYLSPSEGCTKNCDYRGEYDSTKCQQNCGQPAQTLYHIPRSWVHPGENLLVLHEELGGDPTKISVLTRTGQEICSLVSEKDPLPADSWKPNLGFMSQTPEARLTCEKGWRIASINFASFGSPQGNCGEFRTGICHADIISMVQKACIGQEQCSIPVSTANLGDPCPGILKSLAIEALCSD
ncbi:hypothetical protein QUC31_013006 [Theobroma cacao]